MTGYQGYCWPSLGEPCGNCHRCGPQEPEPCEGCYYVYGDMRVCDGGCNGVNSQEDAERRAAMYADPEGLALVKAIHDRKANHDPR